MPPSSATALSIDRAAVRGILHVARQQHGLAAGVLDQALGLLRVVVLAEIGDQHVGAFAGEGDRHGAADAAVAAGDDRPFAGQPSRAFVGRLAVIGDGLHLRWCSRASAAAVWGKAASDSRSWGAVSLSSMPWAGRRRSESPLLKPRSRRSVPERRLRRISGSNSESDLAATRTNSIRLRGCKAARPDHAVFASPVGFRATPS